MRDIGSRGRAVAAIAVGALVIVLGTHVPSATGQTPAPFDCNGFPPVRVSSTLPPDLNAAAQQPGADCYAWQSFIALNWRAGAPGRPDPSASPSQFGRPPADPTHPAPTVWETFVDRDVALTPNGRRPASNAPLLLSMTSKVGHRTVLSDTGQAFTNGAWLTDQAHGLTYYQVLVNQDEYAYIQKNKLYSAAGQRACVAKKAGFNLPDGTERQSLCDGTPYNFGSDGSIEIKAAWVVLDPADTARMQTFLTARACIVPPDTHTCGPGTPLQTVGLVGLHIIRKTRSAQQFVWSTFEHVDNDPDRDGPSTGRYTYFNPNCDPNHDPYRCEANRMPVPSPTAGATISPRDAAIQVVRALRVSNLVTALNKSVHGSLPAGSVFTHYRLIDAIWPTTNRRIASGAFIPLSDGAPQVEMQPLTNTTMETYFQTPEKYTIPKDGCMDCHMSASISRSKNVRTSGSQEAIVIADPRKTGSQQGVYASDYSFIFFGVK
jgi:hypothetical protein